MTKVSAQSRNIEKYILRRMSDDEKLDFESCLMTEPELFEQFEKAQRQFDEILTQEWEIELTETLINDLPKKKSNGKWLVKIVDRIVYGLAPAAVGLLFGVAFMFQFNQSSLKTEELPIVIDHIYSTTLDGVRTSTKSGVVHINLPVRHEIVRNIKFSVPIEEMPAEFYRVEVNDFEKRVSKQRLRAEDEYLEFSLTGRFMPGHEIKINIKAEVEETDTREKSFLVTLTQFQR